MDDLFIYCQLGLLSGLNDMVWRFPFYSVVLILADSSGRIVLVEKAMVISQSLEHLACVHVRIMQETNISIIAVIICMYILDMIYNKEERHKLKNIFLWDF